MSVELYVGSVRRDDGVVPVASVEVVPSVSVRDFEGVVSVATYDGVVSGTAVDCVDTVEGGGGEVNGLA